MGEIRPKECEPRELTKDQLAVWALLVLMTAAGVAVLTLLWKRNMISDLRQTFARLTGGEAQGDKALFEPIVSAS